MQFLSRVLDNGLEVVAECNPQAVSCAVGFFVKTGARDESDALSGVSHFLEHMVFKGTSKRSPEDVNREFDEFGAMYNAMTSDEKTVYYATLLPEYLERAVELWSDILRPALRTEDFETEKQVILEEIKMYEDSPPYGADEKCKANYFQDHPLARSVLGTTESVSGMQVDGMRAYFAKHYSPSNIVLAAAGKVEFEELVRLADKYCGKWAPTDVARATSRVTPHLGFQVMHHAAASQEYVLQLSEAPKGSERDRFAAGLLTMILGDDSGSRLYWELVDPGLAETVSISYQDFIDCGIFYTYLSCSPERCGENLQRMYDVFADATRTGILAEELSQAKNKLCSGLVLSSERPRNRMFKVGGGWVKRREYLTVTEILERVRAISVEQVQGILEQFPLSRGATVAVGPAESIAPPQAAATA